MKKKDTRIVGDVIAAIESCDEDAQAWLKRLYNSFIKLQNACIAVKSANAHIESANTPEWLDKVEAALRTAEKV